VKGEWGQRHKPKPDRNKQNWKQKNVYSQAPVLHACNPSYSGGRDQEDSDLKPAQANSSQDPILKKFITTKGLKV
jgi:hypothetical protein